MKSHKSLVVALMAAGVLGAGVPEAQAAAVAQAILEVSNFTIVLSQPPESFTFNNTVDASADLNGVNAAGAGDTIDPDIFELAVVGPDAGAYSPGTPYLPNPGQHDYAGAFADVTGNALTGAANSLVDTTVVLESPGDGSAQANSGVTARGDLAATGDTSVTFAMTVEGFLRTDLDQPETFAQADISWVLTIRDSATQAVVFQWTPDLINQALSLDSEANEFTIAFGPTDLSISTILAPGNYQLGIRHETNADARWIGQQVPEPGSLSLLALGLLGVGTMLRRRNAA